MFFGYCRFKKVINNTHLILRDILYLLMSFFLKTHLFFPVSYVYNTSSKNDLLLLYIVNRPINSFEIGILEHATTWQPIIHVYSIRQDPLTTCPPLTSFLEDLIPSQPNHSINLRFPFEKVNNSVFIPSPLLSLMIIYLL